MMSLAEARKVKMRRDWKAPTRTALYRLFDDAGTLLYIGITMRDVGDRFNAHSGKHAWWPEVTHVTLEWFDGDWLALDAELRAIKTEGPKYNKRGMPPHILTEDAVSPHCARNEASRLPHDRKGREGNRKGSGKENTEFSTHPQSPPANRGDASAAPRPEVSR